MARASNGRLGDIRVVSRDSGQVYTEAESAAPVALSNGATWVHESPYMPLGWEETSPNEASPLRHLAMRKLLSDQRSLSPSLFTNVPWGIARDIWDMLGRCKKQTLHMWKLLATVYPAQFAEMEKYRSMKIEGPKLSMRDYLGLTKSDSLSWRVALTLATSYSRVPEIVGISEIKNLCALDIATPTTPDVLPENSELQLTTLTDRIVRAWSELAQTSEAFKHLRVLILRHQRQLSKVALHYFRTFPTLQTVITFDCPGIESAVYGGQVNGWIPAEEEQSAPATLYGFYEASCKASIDKSSIPAETPILDFQIGQMVKAARGPVSSPYAAIYLERSGDGGVDTGPSTRKRKDIASDGQHGRKGKPVMKTRTQDIGDVLSSFF
ncbi:hypothetical protein BDV18DRAFT_158576 [Aspergillus unguis]